MAPTSVRMETLRPDEFSCESGNSKGGQVLSFLLSTLLLSYEVFSLLSKAGKVCQIRVILVKLIRKSGLVWSRYL